MPIFSYTAVDRRGEVSRATIVADSQSAAAARLTAKGLTPLVLAESEDEGLGWQEQLARLGRVRLREITLFLRMLAALLGSGITITESLAVLCEQTMNRKFKYILGDIKAQIEGGVAFSAALGGHPRIFPQTMVSMVRAGELGGIIEDVLHNLVTYLEKRSALKSMLIRIFIYPSIVVVVATVVVVFLVVFVIPRFSTLLKGGKLPWNTQLLLDVADFLTRNGKLIIMTGAGGAAALALLFLVPEIRVIIDRYKIRLPLFGPIFQLGVIVQFTRTLAALLESGIPIVEGLKIVRDTLSNAAVKKNIDTMVEKVVGGERLSEVMAAMPLFTSLTVSMFRIGEQSGNIDQSVALVADIHEQQLEARINWMSALIEPTLIISLGAIVGFVAWGLVAGMLAMYARGA